jgi:acetyl-CoA acetyltransferase
MTDQHRRVAVTGFARSIQADSEGLNEAELLGPVVDRALEASGLAGGDIELVCSATSEFLNGVIGSMMAAFDALPCWPPVAHSHLEGDGAFAMYEAWVRLLAGEADAALVCAYSRPLAREPETLLAMQLDPYLVSPLSPARASVAALQARALIDFGRHGEQDFARVVASRRPGTTVTEVLSQPYVASPLRGPDCSTLSFGAAALVLATGRLVSQATAPPAWIAGMEQKIESGSIGARDLVSSASTRAAATELGVPGSSLDVVELHAPFSHQELILVDALGASEIGAVNPSGGALPADPMMATGLIRMGEAASAIFDRPGARAVGHATNGPCLQHNLVCLLERDA